MAKDRPNPFNQANHKLILEFGARKPVRTGSMLITIFGDAIAPHGGTVWLGSLIKVMESFGVNQRAVRTSVFRLIKDGWLISDQIGRKSYYKLSTTGRERFDEATHRIYGEPRHEWNGTWTLAILGGVNPKHRDSIKKELSWLGFAPFSTNLMAHPAPYLRVVEDLLHQLDGHENVVIMDATSSDSRRESLGALVHNSWDLENLSQQYGEFLDRLRPLYQAIKRTKSLDPETAFQARSILVHEYRRVLLRDPMLPDALLPDDWNGVAAYQLCRNIYALISPAAEEFLREHMESADGPLPPADPHFYQRFGGLTKP